MKFEILYRRSATNNNYELRVNGGVLGWYRSRTAAMVALENYLAIQFCNDHVLCMTVQVWN